MASCRRWIRGFARTEEIAHTLWFTVAYHEQELVAIKSNLQSFLMLFHYDSLCFLLETIVLLAFT